MDKIVFGSCCNRFVRTRLLAASMRAPAEWLPECYSMSELWFGNMFGQ